MLPWVPKNFLHHSITITTASPSFFIMHSFSSSSGQCPGPLHCPVSHYPITVSNGFAPTISTVSPHTFTYNTNHFLIKKGNPWSSYQLSICLTARCSRNSHNRVDKVIKHAWADSTAMFYSTAVRQFINFCDSEPIPCHLRLPASKPLLCTFAASFAGKYSGSSVYSKIAALKAWHNVQGVPWHSRACLCCVLNRTKNLAPSSSKLSPHSPVTITILTTLSEKLDLNDSFDLAVTCTAVLAFWGQCRLGELLPASNSLHHYPSLPTHSDILSLVHNKNSLTLHLPHTKTHHSGQDIVIISQLEHINLISLYTNTFESTVYRSPPLYFHTDHLKAYKFIWRQKFYSTATKSGLNWVSWRPWDIVSELGGQWSCYLQAFCQMWWRLLAVGHLIHSCATGACLTLSHCYIWRTYLLLADISSLPYCLIYHIQYTKCWLITMSVFKFSHYQSLFGG